MAANFGLQPTAAGRITMPPRLKPHVRHHRMSARRVERELMAADGRHKVEIFRRENGTYGFAALRWSDEPLERCWVPFGRYSECFALDADSAVVEAKSRVEWLR